MSVTKTQVIAWHGDGASLPMPLVPGSFKEPQCGIVKLLKTIGV